MVIYLYISVECTNCDTILRHDAILGRVSETDIWKKISWQPCAGAGVGGLGRDCLCVFWRVPQEVDGVFFKSVSVSDWRKRPLLQRVLRAGDHMVVKEVHDIRSLQYYRLFAQLSDRWRKFTI